MPTYRRDPFIDKVAQDIAGDKSAIEKLRQQEWDADRLAFRRALGLPDELGPISPPPDWEPPLPPEDLFPVSEGITPIRPITEPPPGFKMPVGELRPLTTEEIAKQAVIPSKPKRVPTFSEWSTTKGFDMVEYGSMLRQRGVAEADIPEMLLKTQSDLRDVYEYEFGLGRWGRAGGELEKIAIGEPQRLLEVGKVLGQSLTRVPKQVGASILQAAGGAGGASVTDRDWTGRLIQSAQTDLGKFAQEISEKYPDSKLMENLAQLPQNIAFSLTSMGAGLGVGVPIALAGAALGGPVGLGVIRGVAWGAGSAASGLVAYNMTAYQIMQQYLEAKNEEMVATRGSGITTEEEKRLKADFEGKARAYGLWEAVPEAISNLAFARILTAPLTRIAGRSIAARMIEGLTAMYGQELLTETITQKGQTAIEVDAGLREGRISWTEAFKEVAPQTFLLTTILGGVGSVGIASVNKVKQSLKTEVGSGHPLYQTLLNGIDDRLAEVIEQARIAPERGAITPERFLPKKKPEVTPAPEVTTQVKLPSGTTADIVETEPGRIWEIRVLGEQAGEMIESYGTATVFGGGQSFRVSNREEGFRKLQELASEQEQGIRRRPAIPRAEAAQTWTEAGIQPSMLPEDVVAIEIRPPTKGKITQISMDDQLKLQQAKEAAERAEVEVAEAKEAYQAQWEIEALKAVHQVDPVAQKRIWIAKRRVGKGEKAHMVDQYVGLDSNIFTIEGEMGDYFTLKQARLLTPDLSLSRYTQKGLPTYNKVPSDILDEMATELGYTTPDELINRINQIRREKAQIKELQKVVVGETLTDDIERLSEQLKAKLELEEQQASPEATLEANREKKLKLDTEPRQEGEIPRQTVRHPSHYRGVEDFNAEVEKELLTAIPEVPLDVAATEYLKTGDLSKYIELMPDISELKLAALTGEVHTAVGELTTARKLAVEEITNLKVRKAEALEVEFAEETVRMWDSLIEEAQAKQDLFGGLIDKARAKRPLTIDDAVALGIALRRTKGGKLVPAIRRSGFYVTNEFVDSPYLQDVPYQQGFWEDVDSLFEHIDGGRAAGTPDAPAVAQKYIQRPSQRNFLAYKSFLDAKFQEAQDIFERFGLTGPISKQKWADVFNTIEQITAVEADFKTAQLLRKTEIADILAKYSQQTKTNIVEFAQGTRAFLDQLRDGQNQARTKRQQKEIGYIDKYMAWVAERNIWSSLGFQKRTPADMHAQAPAPDYIMPDAPFNARAMTREGGMKNYPLERNVHKLLFDYIRTAGRDIFFTNTVQNNKIHIAALKAKGFESTATLLEEYNAEVWAGAKPRLTKAYEAFLPRGIAKATYIIRRNLTRAVFPLNWVWNVTIQPSSIAFTAGRTGFINLAKGLDFLFLPSARAFANDSYSYIIKSKRAGRLAFQDIGTQVEQSLQFEGSLIDKAEYYASFITNTLESLLTGISIRAGYYKGLKLGFTGQELMEYASKMGAKTQSMYNVENVPAVLRAKAVGALFPFQTFTIQAMNYVREMNYIRVGKAGAYNTISAKTAGGKATISRRLALTASFLIAIWAINMVVDRLTNRKPWIVSSFIPMFAILQAGLEPGDAWYLPLPAKYVNDFWRGFNDVVKYDDLTRLKRWVLLYHFPFAGSQINRMIDGAEAVSRGQMEDVKGKPKFEVRPDEWLKAIFMGPYQTEGGHEYIDRLDESREKKAKWYEYLKIPILISRVDINSEIKENLAKVGEIDEDGMRYDFGDFASSLRDIRQSVGERRFGKAVSPILDGFRKAEASREIYEKLPPQKLINMDEYDIAGFLFPAPDAKETETVQLWTSFNTAKTKDDRVAVITEFIAANKDTLKDNPLVRNFRLLQDYWSLIGEDKKEFVKHYDVLSLDWRSAFRRSNPKDDALLAMWGYGGKIQTQEAYDFIIKWSKEYGVDTAHLPLDIERTEADLALIPYWELPSSPESIRKSYRAANPDIQALLEKYHGYKPLVPYGTAIPSQGERGLDLREELIKRMGGGK